MLRRGFLAKNVQMTFQVLRDCHYEELALSKEAYSFQLTFAAVLCGVCFGQPFILAEHWISLDLNLA